MNLGLVAGGAAKGYNDAEQLKLKKLQDRRAEEEFARSRKKWETEDRVAASPVRMPGQSTTDNYDPTEAIRTAQAGAIPATPHHTSLAGRIAQKLGIGGDAAATAAGVTPPPVQTGALPAPGQQSAKPSAEAGPGAVDEVVVQAAKPKDRNTTIADTLYDQAIALREARAPMTEQIAAFKAWNEAATKEHVKLLGTASAPEMSRILSKATGQDVDIIADEDGGYTLNDSSGHETKFKDRDHLVMQLQATLEGNPAEAVKANMLFRQEDRQELVAKAAYNNSISTMRHQATQDRLDVRKDDRDTETHTAVMSDRQTALDAIDFLGNPDNAILYPEQWAAASGAATRAMPTYAKGYTKDPEGNSRPVNIFEQRAQDQAKAWAQNPLVQQGVLATATGADGTRGFKVKVGDKWVGYKTMDEAKLAASRAYPAKKK